MSDTNTGLSFLEIFGEPISTYSRLQAIADLVLIDVTATAVNAGLKFPTAMTAAAFDETVYWTPQLHGDALQDEGGRLWDVVWMLRTAIRAIAPGDGPKDRIDFSLYVVPHNKRKAELITLKALIGPGDHGEPVLTIMLPDED